MKDLLSSPTRRQLLAMIGKIAGATAMYQAMTALGFASESSFKQEIELKGAPAGACPPFSSADHHMAGMRMDNTTSRGGYAQ